MSFSNKVDESYCRCHSQSSVARLKATMPAVTAMTTSIESTVRRQLSCPVILIVAEQSTQLRKIVCKLSKVL